MIRRWFRNWFVIDLLALGAGATSTILYILYANQVTDAHEPYKDIWSNLGTEILGVWISVRIIDALIGAREERDRVRNAVVGNLNFMMGICQDIPPNFDGWRINDLDNEIMWFEEKRNSEDGAKKLGRFFTSDEIAGIDKVLESAKAVDSIAHEVQKILAKFKRLAETDFRWQGPEEIKGLYAATERLNRGDLEADAEMSHWLDLVKQNIETQKYKDDVATNAGALISNAAELASLNSQMRKAVAEVETTLANLRRSIATRN